MNRRNLLGFMATIPFAGVVKNLFGSIAVKDEDSPISDSIPFNMDCADKIKEAIEIIETKIPTENIIKLESNYKPNRGHYFSWDYKYDEKNTRSDWTPVDGWPVEYIVKYFLTSYYSSVIIGGNHFYRGGIFEHKLDITENKLNINFINFPKLSCGVVLPATAEDIKEAILKVIKI